VRRVADAHRLGGFVPFEPRHFPFPKPSFASDSVHDLQLIGTAGGSAHQPVAPVTRLFGVTSVHQGKQRERRVTHPAKSVIPISNPADLFGQGGRHGGGDAARGGVRQRLERDQRTPHGIRPWPGFAATTRPLQPELFGIIERGKWIRQLRRRQIRGRVREHKGYALARRDSELA
jgi:hypothetical protein